MRLDIQAAAGVVEIPADLTVGKHVGGAGGIVQAAVDGVFDIQQTRKNDGAAVHRAADGHVAPDGENVSGDIAIHQDIIANQDHIIVQRHPLRDGIAVDDALGAGWLRQAEEQRQK